MSTVVRRPKFEILLNGVISPVNISRPFFRRFLQTVRAAEGRAAIAGEARFRQGWSAKTLAKV